MPDKKDQMTADNNAVLESSTNENSDTEKAAFSAESQHQDIDIEALKKSYTEATLQIAALKEQLMRTQADMQNLQRRAEKDIANAHKFGLERFSLALLPVADSLEKALEHMQPEKLDEQMQALYEGVKMTATLLTETFKKFQLEPIEPMGEPFDPNYHEAMAMIDQPNVEPNTVINVLQKGYSLNGRSIRPAMVVIAKSTA